MNHEYIVNILNYTKFYELKYRWWNVIRFQKLSQESNKVGDGVPNFRNVNIKMLQRDEKFSQKIRL